jgi:malate dehydrogenase (oxaloacetate-decarboxylating)
MDELEKRTLHYRKKYRGVMGVGSKIPLRDRSVLSVIYTPGVAEPCRVISQDPGTSFELTCRGNTVAVVTDGSRVLGLGNLGPLAALPVMEGKSVIFKTFAGVDAIPICLATQRTEEITQAVLHLEPTFAAICLEDIVAPRCFELEEQLERATNLPVFGNDYQAVGAAVLAGLHNGLKLTGKSLSEARIVVNGAGAAGIGVSRLLLAAGARNIVLCDRAGALHHYRGERMNWAKAEIARMTNADNERGTLPTIIQGADVFIGFSEGGVLTGEMVGTMAKDAIVFALAVPEPEIMPEEARKAGAAVVATARSDFSNQIDTALVFPGLARGLLAVRSRGVGNLALIAAADAVAELVSEEELSRGVVVPRVMDFHVAPAVAEAVAKCTMEEGLARITVDPKEVGDRLMRYIYENEMTQEPALELAEDEQSIEERSLDLHRQYQGILQVVAKLPVKDHHILSTLVLPPAASYAPLEIHRDSMKVFDYTTKANLIAVATDGSAVLGLGNIGPRAALPVMEGKAVLFNTFAGVEAFPLCLNTQDVEEFIQTISYVAPTFGGINLEDISAPRCFEIEDRLQVDLDIPVFHDDQHGTAVVVLAGLISALKLKDMAFSEARVVINGAGAAGIAIAKLLMSVGIQDIIFCDSRGAIYQGRAEGMNPIKESMAEVTNQGRVKGGLAEAMAGSDVFIGVSVADLVTEDMVRSMAAEPVVFALANPEPEIMPDLAQNAGALVVATGRSDFKNQINNSLAFPGIFRGALDVRARDIDREMKIAAAHALAAVVEERGGARPDFVIPNGLDFRVPPKVAGAVAQAALDTGIARLRVDPKRVEENTRAFIYENRLEVLS